MRDWLVVERLRLFRLKRAIDAYARTVDSELLECVEAGRELGAKIALPIWENVWKTSLQEEMRRVCAVSEWTRPEQAMKKSAYGPLSFDDVLASRVGDALRDCERQEFARARKAGAPEGLLFANLCWISCNRLVEKARKPPRSEPTPNRFWNATSMSRLWG